MTIAHLCLFSLILVPLPACHIPGRASSPAVLDSTAVQAGSEAVAVAFGQAITADFDAALRGLNFPLATTDFNAGPSMAGNGMLDADEMALVAAVLADPALDLSARGGVRHAEVRAAYEQVLAAATRDTASLVPIYPTSPLAVTGYALLGDASFQAMAAMTAAFQAPLVGNYELGRALTPRFSAEGDADGDGASNLAEYEATIERGREAYVAAALDPGVRPAPDAPATVYWCPMRGRPCAERDFAEPGKCPECGMALVSRRHYESSRPATPRKRVGVVLFPGFEALDVYGPVEMWGNVPELELVVIAETIGPVRSAQGPATLAEVSFANAPPLEILFVPGGMGTMAQLANPAMLAFLEERRASTELMTSVCTGSLLLAAAGLLDDRNATTNKLYFSMTRQHPSVHWQPSARWVDDGDVVTSSGVSAGLDMALHVIERLYGRERADEIARWTEYVRNRDSGNDPFAAPSQGK